LKEPVNSRFDNAVKIFTGKHIVGIIAAGTLLVPLLLATLMLTGNSAWGSGLNTGTRITTGGWSVRWGDSPKNADGSLAWLSEPVASPDWQPTHTLSFDREAGKNNLWFKTRLVSTWAGRDPSIYIHSVDTNFELYLDGKLIYQYGSIDNSGKGRFAGWPWFVIPLPANFNDKVLSIRIFSDVGEIGIVGNVVLDSIASNYIQIMRRDIDRIILGALYLFICLLAFVLSIKLQQRGAVIAFGAFSLQVGIWTIAQTEVKQIFLNDPMLWIYLDLTSLYLAPATMAIFIEDMYALGFRPLMRLVKWSSIGYTVGAITLSATGVVLLPSTIAPFNILEFFCLAAILIATGYSALHGSPEARIFATGILLLCPFVIWDILNTWRGWAPPMSHWGLFLFISSLAFILRQRFMKIHSQSIHDSLTGLANRYRFDALLDSEWRRAVRNPKPLALMMVDIDFFKLFNDTYGHTHGDDCLKMVAATLSNRVRQGPDLVARFGGEEFVILLPETNELGALNVAERLRASIDQMAVPHASSSVVDHVTISIGVASVTPEEESSPHYLLESADRALYRAKQTGRNRVCAASEVDLSEHR
jgi:diguanylate cyclase (GGDEF)-like protein